MTEDTEIVIRLSLRVSSSSRLLEDGDSCDWMDNQSVVVVVRLIYSSSAFGNVAEERHAGTILNLFPTSAAGRVRGDFAE